ncbi:MAG: glycosyltransferase [Planctomycetes bacterium]|nr:glycosyltransferase [Planctomycetota bacterium]
MRVTHVITRLIPGGAQENTLDTCLLLARRGHVVQLLAGRLHGQGDTGPELMERARAAGLDVVVIDSLVRPVRPARDVAALFALLAAARRFRPDVIHTHSAKAGVLGRLAGRIAAVKAVIHTIHGLPFYPGQRSAAAMIFRAVERAAAPWADRIITVCDTLREAALAAGIGRRSQFVTVYSGFDVDRFRSPATPRHAVRARLGVAADAPLVGCVGRLVPLKGQDIVIRAFARARTIARRPDARLLLLGEGMLESRLRALATSLLGPEGARFAGHVPAGEVPDLVLACDLIAHGSLREGLARAITQALVAGLPVVAFDLDGAGEVVRDGVNGYCVPPLDEDLFARRLAELIADPERRARMAGAGRDEMAARFRVERMVESIERVYREALEARVRPRP